MKAEGISILPLPVAR